MIIFAALTVTGCDPAADVRDVDVKTVPLLMTYQASEFEPSWSLTLTDGSLIKFRQLDTETGDDFITDSYRVMEQAALSSTGWRITAEGARGTLIFNILDVTDKGGCTHSGSGMTHRDEVTVTSPLNTWRGCGGPEL